MIESTDASNCDRHQVKNKPKPLTHKKRGETRTMQYECMKTWKMTALFVVGLMLLVGVFTNTASAQSSTVVGTSSATGTTLDVTAEDVIDLYITYRVEEDAADSNGGLSIVASGTATVTFSLPTGLSGIRGAWTAAYPQPAAASGEPDIVAFGLETNNADSTPALSIPFTSLGTNSSSTTSYVTVAPNLRNSSLAITTVALTATSVAVTITNSDDTNSQLLRNHSWIKVIFHNVMVGKLLADDADVTMMEASDEHGFSPAIITGGGLLLKTTP